MTSTVRLRDVGSTYGGLSGKTKADFGRGDASFVTFLEVINNTRLRGTALEQVRVAKGERQNRVMRRDLLFNGSSETPEEVALSAVVDFEPDSSTFLNSFCFGFRLRSDAAVDSAYLAYFFRSSSGRSLVASLAQGATRYNIAKTKFLDVELTLPSVERQREIVEALSDADDFIRALERHIGKKQAIKQGLMQQLLTRRTRLPGFTLPWRQVTLGDVLKVRHGKSQRAVEAASGRFPILATGGQIGWARTPLYSKPSVLIGRKGTIDRPQYQDQPFWTVDTLFYTEISASADPRFLYYVFLTVDWRSMNEASGVPSLSSSRIEGVEIELPDVDEQVAVRRVLDDAESEVAALRDRLEKARAMKAGIMQQLLTERTRLSAEAIS